MVKGKKKHQTKTEVCKSKWNGNAEHCWLVVMTEEGTLRNMWWKMLKHGKHKKQRKVAFGNAKLKISIKCYIFKNNSK